MMLKKISIQVGADTFTVEGDSFPLVDVLPLIQLWFAAIVAGDQQKVDRLAGQLHASTETLADDVAHAGG
jgi:hypothetical protein